MRISSILISGAVAAVAVAGSANAAIVYSWDLGIGTINLPTVTVNTTYLLDIRDATNTTVSYINFRLSTSGVSLRTYPTMIPDPNDDGSFVSGSNYTTFLMAPFASTGTNNPASNLSTGFTIGDMNPGYQWFVMNTANTAWSSTSSSARLNQTGGVNGTIAGNFNGVTGYFGFEIFDFTAGPNTISNKRYGWVLYQGNGATGSILGWAWETSGGSITIPAPGAVALLGAAGLVGSRRRRS